MDEHAITKMFHDIFKSINETQRLLDSFPPEHVREITSTPPRRLFAESIFREFVDKEK